ncbi:hypothetical protein ACF082_34260 [Streptomyces lydicus]|uniref:hypothetical protein n=1 Tax=Streptomyces lydicus TaxID=47763 RepID=UPI0036FC2AB8
MQWIAYYNGFGDHDYLETHREGPYATMLEALQHLERRFGAKWVEDNIVALVVSDEDGSIAWYTDDQGVSIHPREQD